jgi:RNA polymerase sigma-B factor
MELGACQRPVALDVPRREWDAIPDPGREDEDFGRLEGQWLVSDLPSHLDELDRDLLRMRFVDGLSQSEIASRRGWSQMRVSRSLVKTFTRLRALAEAS